MFFCNPCREANNWPESMVRSRGTCEVCVTGPVECFDVRSPLLPPAPEPVLAAQRSYRPQKEES